MRSDVPVWSVKIEHRTLDLEGESLYPPVIPHRRHCIKSVSHHEKENDNGTAGP